MATYSDDDILARFGHLAPDATPGGDYSDDDILARFTGRVTQAQPQPEDRGAFAPERAALRNWVNHIQGSTYGLRGLAADWMGDEETRDRMFAEYQREQGEIRANMRPEYTWEHEGDASDWVRYTLASFAPDLAGGLGAGLIGKKVAQAIVDRGTSKLIGDKVGDAAKDILADRAGARATAGAVGMSAGAFAYNEGQMVGDTYGLAGQEALEQGGTLDDVNTAKVVGYGTLAAGLDTASDLLVAGAGKIGPGKKVMDLLDSGKPGWRGRATNAAVKGTGAGLVGGTTETLQSGLQDLGAGKSFEDASFWNEGEFMAGLVGEGIIGAGLAAARTPRADVEQRQRALEEEDRLALQMEQQAIADQARMEAEAEAKAKQAREVTAEQRERIAFGPKFTPKAQWVKDQDALFDQRMSDPNDPIGQKFDEWKVATGTYDNTPATRNKFRKAFAKDASIDMDAEYVRALDAFAKQQRDAGVDPATLSDWVDPTKPAPKAKKPAAPKAATQPKATTQPTAATEPAAPAPVTKLTPDHVVTLAEAEQVFAEANGGKKPTPETRKWLQSTIADKTVDEALATDPRNSPARAEFLRRLTELTVADMTPEEQRAKALQALVRSMQRGDEAPAQRAVMDYLITNPRASGTEVANALGFNSRSAATAAYKRARKHIDKVAKQFGFDPNEIADLLAGPTATGKPTQTQTEAPPAQTEAPPEQGVGSTLAQEVLAELDQGGDADYDVDADTVPGESVDPKEAAQARTLSDSDTVGDAKAGLLEDQPSISDEVVDSESEFDKNDLSADAPAGFQIVGTRGSSGQSRGTKRKESADRIKAVKAALKAAVDAGDWAEVARIEHAANAVREVDKTNLKKMGVDLDATTEAQFQAYAAERRRLEAQDDAAQADATAAAREGRDQPADQEAAAQAAEQVKDAATTFAQAEAFWDYYRPDDQPAFEKASERVQAGFIDAIAPTMRALSRAGVQATPRQLDDSSAGPAIRKVVAEAFRKARKAVYSKKGKAENPTDAGKIRALTKKLTGRWDHKRIHVYDTVQAAVDDGVITAEEAVGAQGWVERGENGLPEAFFIAENIEQGQELGVFLHEVGKHIGIENVLTRQQQRDLEEKVEAWAKANDGSLESRVAQRAMDRIKAAKEMGGTAGRAEIVAYFVEEAVNAGVNPTALKGDSDFARTIRALWAAFKRALRRVRLSNIDSMTAQNVVDLAYGAAKLELGTRYQGSAATFRRFNHGYMGSGEGSQAFSWGGYLAERFGLARDYMDTALWMNPRGPIVTFTVGDETTVVDTAGPPGSGDHVSDVADAIEGVINEAAKSVGLHTEPDMASKYAESFVLGAIERGDDRDVAHDIARMWAELELLADLDPSVVTWEQIEQARAFVAARVSYKVEANRRQGEVYNVDTTIADDEWLTWDRPLDEQPHVIEAIKRFPEHLQEDLGDRVPPEAYNELTGEDLYDALAGLQQYDYALEGHVTDAQYEQATGLSDDRSTAEAITSYFLDAHGIKGTRFLDRRSRSGRGEYSTENFVVYNDKNMVRVARNPGGKTAPGKRQYSKRADRQWVDDHLGETSTSLYNNLLSGYRWARDHTKFIHHAIRDMRADLPQAEQWLKAMLKAERVRSDIKNHVSSIARRFKHLPAHEQAEVNEFLADSTFDQKWGYDPGFERTRKDKNFKPDPVFAARFQKMSPGQQRVIRSVFRHGEDMHQRKKALMKALGIDTQFLKEGQLQGPYAPLKRYGSHAAVLRSPTLVAAERMLAASDTKANRERVETLKQDPKHYVVQYFPNEGEANRFADKVGKGYVTETFPRSKELERAVGPDYKTFERIIGALQADKLGKSAAEQAIYRGIENQVKEMYFHSLDERNARLSGIKRKFRAGFDRNMMRAFVDHGSAEANLIGHMEHGAEANKAFSSMMNDVTKDTAKKRKHMEAANRLAMHYSAMTNPKHTPIQDRIAAATTFWMLTTSVGYHATNATQPLMATLPKVAGDFDDYAGAFRRMMRGYNVARAVVQGGAFDPDIDVTRAPAEYRALLQELQLRQLLDVGMEENLGEFSPTQSGYKVADKTMEFASEVSHSAYQIARRVEAYNRVAAAISAYDTARKHPGKLSKRKTSALEYAVEVVQDTQGDFTHLGAPLVIKRLPKLMTQFRKYQIMMGWLYADAFKAAKFGQNKHLLSGEERYYREASRRFLVYKLMHTGIAAGALGLPLVSSIGGIVFMLTGLFEDEPPEDFDQWAKRTLGDSAPAKMLLEGPLSAIGLDMRAKLGEENIFTVLPYFDPDWGSAEGGLAALAQLRLGPSGAAISNLFRANGHFDNGNLYRGIETMSPKGLKSIMEAFRFANEGYTSSGGDVLVPPETFATWEVALSSLGFPTSGFRGMKLTRSHQFKVREYFSEKSRKLHESYRNAVKNGDSERQQRLKQEWLDLQDAKVEAQKYFDGSDAVLRRQPLSDLLRSPQAQRRRERKEQEALGVADRL